MDFFIKPLTGVRFVAAAWVMLYHYQPVFAAAGFLYPVIHEFLRVGSLGVDLFFALSGFILTHTYLTKIGPKFTFRKAGNFLWLRLARIYPAHFVMLNIAGLAVVAAGLVGAGDQDRSWLNPVEYLKQVLLIQEWGANPSRGWNFVAWSLSMEWLAYILFTVLVLLLWRLRDKLPAYGLGLISFLCLTPLLWIGVVRDYDPFLTSDWGSSIRVLTEFAAGAFAYLAVRRICGTLGPSKRARSISEVLAWVIPLVIVAISVLLGRIPSLQWADLPNEAPRLYVAIVPFLVLWIAVLAIAKKGIAKFFSTERLLLGGFISYSLYLVHIVWYGLWRAGMSAVGIDSGPLYWLGIVGLIGGTIVFAYLLWRWVEEPAREWMRKRVGAKAKAVAEPQ